MSIPGFVGETSLRDTGRERCGRPRNNLTITADVITAQQSCCARGPSDDPYHPNCEGRTFLRYKSTIGWWLTKDTAKSRAKANWLGHLRRREELPCKVDEKWTFGGSPCAWNQLKKEHWVLDIKGRGEGKYSCHDVWSGWECRYSRASEVYKRYGGFTCH